ncbi:Fimbrial protein [Escherichia coli]|uniref:Fimbrial protein n=1 Tax=Escherichia coli TaxID=562 RepID=A0A377AU04_ECOLX|nr:Fimbrial protein [Escherichia coli]
MMARSTLADRFGRNTCVLAQDSKQINVQLGDVSLTRFSHGNYGPEKSFIINLAGLRNRCQHG